MRIMSKKSFLIEDILNMPSGSCAHRETFEQYQNQCCSQSTREKSPQGQSSQQVLRYYSSSQRSPRIQFSLEQLIVLENRFSQSHYISKNDVKFLAKILNLSDKRVIYLSGNYFLFYIN